MKITRLSSTEVANISVLPFEKRRAALLNIEEPNVRWGYKPVVDALPKILLAEAPLFGQLPKGNDQLLLSQIKKACKSGPRQQQACLSVAGALIEWRNKESVTGRIVQPEPIRLSVDTLHYCANVAAILDDVVYVFHLDPRASLNLSSGGKEFIRSLIYHTALVGDLRDARVGMLSVKKQKDAPRQVTFETLEGKPKFELDDILLRISETYSIWETILRSRTAASATQAGSGAAKSFNM